MHLVFIIRLSVLLEHKNGIRGIAHGVYPQTQRPVRKRRRRGTDAAGVLLLRQGIRDNAYGALSTTFPTMHISADRKLLPRRHP